MRPEPPPAWAIHFEHFLERQMSQLSDLIAAQTTEITNLKTAVAALNVATPEDLTNQAANNAALAEVVATLQGQTAPAAPPATS
jgi:peptidoglycan hydrolase CwlO-like protein